MANRHVPIPGNYNPEKLTRRRSRREPVFAKHEPVINKSREAWHHHVPYPYRFKWDGAWVCIAFFAAAGLIYKPALVVAGFWALIRCWIWLGFRFPLTTYFFTCVLWGLLGSGRGRRRW